MSTLCWDCANYCKCSWSRGIPIEGWDAQKVEIGKGYRCQGYTYGYISYIVKSCPQFKRDAIDGGQKRYEKYT